MRLPALALLIALPMTSAAQVSVTVVQIGKPSDRSLCRVELCNLANAPIQVGGGMVSQLAVLGGFSVVGGGEEERERAAAEAGFRNALVATAKRLGPIAIQGSAVLSFVRKYPVQVQAGLSLASLAVEMIPERPKSTLRFLTSTEMIALSAGGCDVRYLRARTKRWNADYHQLLGKPMDTTPEREGARFEMRRTKE